MTFSIAPMMKWTDQHCRYFHRILTKKAILFTEMISVDAILYGPQHKLLSSNYFDNSTVIQVADDVKEKKELEKIILCEVQTKIYPDLEKSLLDLLHNSGYPGIKFEKKIDFEALYNKRFN